MLLALSEDPDPETLRRQEACEEILRRMRQEVTRPPGTTLGDAFALCRTFYAEAGFPDGWRDHQGGTTGYASREIVATPETHREIREGHAFAWNPSLPNAKAEETFVLLPQGPESSRLSDLDPCRSRRWASPGR